MCTHTHTLKHTQNTDGKLRLGEEKENDAKDAQWSSRLRSQISGLLQQFSLCPGLAASLSCQLCKQAQAAMTPGSPVHPVLSSVVRAQPTIREDPSLYMSTEHGRVSDCSQAPPSGRATRFWPTSCPFNSMYKEAVGSRKNPQEKVGLGEAAQTANGRGSYYPFHQSLGIQNCKGPREEVKGS